MTPEKAAFMIRYTSGVICVPATQERLDELDLPLMVERNTDSMKTAYTITVDHKSTSTGISAADRSRTIQALANPNSKAGDFNRPGHVFPLRYNSGGVLARPGHTEAGVDFCKLAGKQPVAAISEVTLDNGVMARRQDLIPFAKKWGLKLVTIKDLISYIQTATLKE
jgi:3,4-dihydroxy-2-butanone 4-phosphate synthase